MEPSAYGSPLDHGKASLGHFFPDGTAAVSTYGGDIWLVSGLDADLKEVTWRRFAPGMFEPLGVKVIDGKGLTAIPGIIDVHAHGAQSGDLICERRCGLRCYARPYEERSQSFHNSRLFKLGCGGG